VRVGDGESHVLEIRLTDEIEARMPARAPIHMHLHAPNAPLRAMKRERTSPAMWQPNADEPSERKRPGIGVGIVLALLLGLCCLSSGALSTLGSVLVMLEPSRSRGTDPISGLLSGLFLCVLPGVVLVGFAAHGVLTAQRLRRVVALAETRDALCHEEVAETLGLREATAKALLDRAVREGFIDRAIVEATERQGSRSELARDVAIAKAMHLEEREARPITPEARTEITCPFCKTKLDVSGSEERPRCTGCGTPLKPPR
jgi:DNA-binding MarR family transcriptional regulator